VATMTGEATLMDDAEILAALHTYVGAAMTAGPVPEFGTARWAALGDDDPAKTHAVVRAALAHWQHTQTATEDHVQASRAISAAMGPAGGFVAHTEIVRRRAAVHTARAPQTAAQIRAGAAFSWRHLDHQHAHQFAHRGAEDGRAGDGATSGRAA